MITEEKIKELRKQLRRGIPEGEIKRDLVREGYTEEDIAKIFLLPKANMCSWYLFFAIIFIIAGSWFFSLLLFVASAIMFSLYYADNIKQKKL
jgi:hypothetical protein